MNQGLEKRRSIYNISDEIEISDKEIVQMINKITELVPDAYNMKSARVLVVLNDKHKQLWDNIYDVFKGKVAKEKIDGFKAGKGTILFFYDQETLDKMINKFPKYAENFRNWSREAGGMLQFTLWTAFAEKNIGASLQHYNPVIDDMIYEKYDVPKNYKLTAQLVFGKIEQYPEPKEQEDISKRVKIIK